MLVNNLRLTEKITLLVLGVALFVGVAIASVGDWTLRRVSTDLKQARLSHSQTAQIGVNDSVTPVVRSDGRVVGMLVVRGGASDEPTIINASHSPAAGKNVVFISANSLSATEDFTAPIEQMRSTLLSTTAMVMLLAGVVGLLFARSVTEPFSRLTVDMKRLAKGETDLKFTDASRKDEVGEMSRALETVRDSIVEMNRSTKSGDASPLRLDTAVNAAIDNFARLLLSIGQGLVDLIGTVARELASAGREIGKLDLAKVISAPLARS